MDPDLTGRSAAFPSIEIVALVPDMGPSVFWRCGTSSYATKLSVANLLYDLLSTAKLYERQIVRCENVHMAAQQPHVMAIYPQRSMTANLTAPHGRHSSAYFFGS
jgi:hypothetical protein